MLLTCSRCGRAADLQRGHRVSYDGFSFLLMPQSHNCSGFCRPSLPWPAPATSYSLVCSWATCVQCSMPAHRAAPRLVALVPSSHAQSFIAHAQSFFAPAASVQCCVIHHSVAPQLSLPAALCRFGLTAAIFAPSGIVAPAVYVQQVSPPQPPSHPFNF